MGACIVCGESAGRMVNGRCDTDYRFRRRHGRDRTEAERVEANTRTLERELELAEIRRVGRAYGLGT